MDRFETQSQEFLALINSHIEQQADRFLEQGYLVAILNSAAVIGYGSSKDPLMCDFKDKIEHVASFPEDALCDAQSEAARRMAYTTLNAFLLRKDDPNKLAGIHASLVFVQYMVSHPWTAHLVPIDFPWTAFADFLNNLLTEYDTSDGVIDDEVFPISRRDDPRPCLEDYALRGLLWADICFPEGWFPDELEDHPQIPSTSLMAADRKRRILQRWKERW